MKYADYPCLFQKSDTASTKQQNAYLLATKIEFFFILIAAFFSSFILSDTACSVITAVSLGLAFITRVLIQLFKWDRKWFDTRAIAESAKTATWRYIMAAEPYQSSLSPADVDKMLVDEMSEIFKARPEVHSAMAACITSGDQQITDRMREIRSSSVEDRKNLYVAQRVKDQRKWYKSKAKFNEVREHRWVFCILGCEVLGIAMAVGVIFWKVVIFNPLGLITTLVAVFNAWIQIKRHRELSQSYAMAEQELASIESLGPHVTTENDLREYVINTEGAISREHTMWCAKRI